MEKSTLSVPGMWADHHVLAVRDALGKLPGVANVYASAMKRQVDVEFDPKAVSAEAIVKGLAAAGYAPGPLAEAAPAPRNKPEWAINVLRVTATNQADGALSGDFRRY